MIQISDGLVDLQYEKTFHGNLKLTNILLLGSGNDTVVKLIDYEGFPGCSVNRSDEMISKKTRLI